MKLGRGINGPRPNVDVGGVLHTGRELDIDEALVLPEFASFAFPAPVAVSLSIRRIGRGLDVRGSVVGVAEGECARCLDGVRLPLNLEIDERIVAGGDRDDPLAENNVLEGDQLDLQDLVRQVIDSALPLAVLCDDDCRGLCTTCGHKRDGTCRCTHPE
ncbi:MAG: DUF177 domain-containing protein [Candidatus Eremiobacteraeota bacterium]|nr:DUF177 domain-containing protein [Candidatus Eremiobacteraeota bacterium]